MYTPERGDIIQINFDPQAGHEQQKRMPALVISDTRFNSLGLAVVCPITSTAPRHGFHIVLPKDLKTHGNVMTEQLKSLDYTARKAKYVESAPIGFIHYIRGIISQFL
jgi:mRNA-degrading endonuclease toxin of MazEF toxin-antitoxin module